jgi:hypothetical protein
MNVTSSTTIATVHDVRTDRVHARVVAVVVETMRRMNATGAWRDTSR